MKKKNSQSPEESPSHPPFGYRSDGLLIEPQSGRIANRTDSIRFGPVNMGVLLILISKRGEVVSRSEIFDNVWKNQIVSDDALTRCISDIRNQLKGLAESSNLIETIPKRGYRWLPEVKFCEVESSEVEPCEVELSDGTESNSQSDSIENKSPVDLEPVLNPAAGLVNTGVIRNRLSKKLATALAMLLVFLLMSASLNWAVHHLFRNEVVKVALLPIKTEPNVDINIASELEELMRGQLLSSANLRFLSTRAINIHPQTPYPNLAREFGTQWVIEGNIRKNGDHIRVTMSLVDAKTALVFYRFSREIIYDPLQMEQFCATFLSEIQPMLQSETN